LASAAVILNERRSSDFMCKTIDAFDPFRLARIIHPRRSIKGVSEADVAGCV
jgi:hypothetical protein